MLRHARLLVLASLLLPAAAGAQATLNKCIDARGAVTYSNLPCKDARETHKVEVDPAPPAAAPPAPSPSAPRSPVPATGARSAPPAAGMPAPAPRPAARPGPAKPPALGSSRHCEQLSSQLGALLDKMDQARASGLSPAQIDAWNPQVRELERKKQQAGCF